MVNVAILWINVVAAHLRRTTIGIGHKACLLKASFKTSFTCGNGNPTRKYFKVGSSDPRGAKRLHPFLMLPKGMYCRLSLVTLDCPLGWIFRRRNAIVEAGIMAQRFRKRKECLCRMLIITASASTLKWKVRDRDTSELSSRPAGLARGDAAGTCG
jgi:hypothetical protein